MHMIYTEDQAKKNMEALMLRLESMMKEAQEKSKKVKEWQHRHPPCPHCGHQEQLPIYLQY